MRPKRQAALRLFRQKTDPQSGNHPKPRRHRKITPLRRGSLAMGFQWPPVGPFGVCKCRGNGLGGAAPGLMAKCRSVLYLRMGVVTVVVGVGAQFGVACGGTT